MLLFGLVYMIPVVQRRLKPMPIWLWVAVGLVPIMLDGFSQLFSEYPYTAIPLVGQVFSFLPERESTPELSNVDRRVVWPFLRVAGVSVLARVLQRYGDPARREAGGGLAGPDRQVRAPNIQRPATAAVSSTGRSRTWTP